MLKKLNVKKNIIFVISSALIIFITFIITAGISIGHGVKDISQSAMIKYPSCDEVQALIMFVDSGENSLSERNRAIWALGQIGDKRALEVLRKYYTGKPCNHSENLCRYELKKAINLCEGGTNITAFIWRQ